MEILGKLREKLSRRKPREDLRDYEEIEKVQRERDRLRRLREKVFQQEKEKVLKEKWRREARKKAEREAYGWFTPSRKAPIVSLMKGKEKTKKQKKKRNIVKQKQRKPNQRDMWRMI